MSVFLQALFVQCERILHNHSFVIRTLHLIAEKQEAGDSVHKLIMGDEAVWRRMQDVLVDVFELYWERPSLDVFTDENVASTEEYEFTFVFEDAHGNDTPQDEEDASGAQASGAGRKGKINNVAGLEPSPLHASWSYTSIQSFIANVDKIVKDVHSTSARVEESSEPMTMETCHFGTFIDNKVLDVYFPFLKEEVTTYFKTVMLQPDAFKPVSKIHRYTSQAKNSWEESLLTGGVRTMEIVEYLFSSMIHMPKHEFVDKFVVLIQEVVDAFEKECETKFRKAVGGTAAAMRLPATLIKTDEKEAEGARLYSDFLVDRDPLFAALRRERGDEDADTEVTGSDADTVTAFNMEERDFDMELFSLLSTDSKDKRHLEMMDWNGAVLLAAISTTLDWLAAKIIELVSRPVDEFPASMVDVWTDKVKVAYPDLVGTAKKCRQNSDNCMLYLRTELRHHCFNDLKSVDANWNFEDEDTETDSSIVKLSRNLSNIEYRVAPYLSPGKCSYLFSHLGWVVSNILIKSLSHISEINAFGARKRESSIYQFVRNLGNFANIGPDIMELIYSRVRNYYGFFSDEDPHGSMLLSIQTAGPMEFAKYTIEEYEVLFNKTQDKAQTVTMDDLTAAFNAQDNSLIDRRKADVMSRLPHGYF